MTQHLMVILPQGAGLEIEATLANKDVGFVHKGRPVEIKVETFNFTRYGLSHGTVVSISQDTVNPDESGGGRSSRRGNVADEKERQAGQPTYVALAAKGIQTEQGFTELKPGMAVTAEIKTGKRAIVDFLLSPLQRLARESLKER